MADFEDGLEGFLTDVDDDGQKSESLRGGRKFVIVCRQPQVDYLKLIRVAFKPATSFNKYLDMVL